MGNATFIPINLLAMSQVTAQAASEASASMAASNLLIERPSKFWRSDGGGADSAWVRFYTYDTALWPVSAVALVGHNLRRGDQYRVVTTTDDSLVLGYAVVNPNSTIAAVNCDSPAAPSIHFDVADGDAPDADYAYQMSGLSPWSLHLGFNSPGGTPNVGADLQMFRVLVTVNSVPGNVASCPTIKCELYEAGVLRADLGTKLVTSDTGQWLFFPWDISTYNAADIEIKLSGTSPPSGTYTVRVHSIYWAAEYPAVQTASNFGGTWATFDPFEGSQTYRPEGAGPSETLVVNNGSVVNVESIIVYIRSDHAPGDFDIATETLRYPDGYVQVGVAVAGEAWSPGQNVSYGKLTGTVDSSPRVRSYGGQIFGSRRLVRRVVSTRFGHLTPAEAHSLYTLVLWLGGTMKPIIVSVLPDDSIQSRHTTIFGVLRNPENWLNIQAEEGYENSIDVEWEEVL